MLLPLVTPEIVMGVALLLLFLQIFNLIGLGTTAQAIGQITFTIVVRRRDRPRAGSSRSGRTTRRPRPTSARRPSTCSAACCCRCSRRRSSASSAVVFAISIDDFVVTQYLSGDASTQTVSMLLYSSARGAPTPALNALATIALAITLFTLALVFFVYRRFAGGEEATAVAALEV